MASGTFQPAQPTRRPAVDRARPGCRVFLPRLAPGEAPPILRQAMLDPATVTVLAGAATPARRWRDGIAEHPLQLQSPDGAAAVAPLLLRRASERA